MDGSIDIFIIIFTFCLLLIWFGLCSIIYYYTKIKSFRYYAIYCIFLALYCYTKIWDYFPILDLYKIQGFPSLNWITQLIYNCFYFLFAISFLNLKEYLPRLRNFIWNFAYLFLILGSIVYVVMALMGRSLDFAYFFLFLFLPLSQIFSLYTIYRVWFIDNRLRFYMISASLIYSSFAMLSLYYSIPIRYLWGFEPLSWFMFGIIIESSIFALGLGYKVHLINQDRNNTRSALIQQLQENEIIKQETNERLTVEVEQKTKELAGLIEEREENKREKLKMEYEQELLEMSLTSLRNQMNPHFIFNALNAIKHAIINKRQEDAVQYLNKFSKILREVLKNSESKEYSLQEEIDTLKLYMNLENIRFESPIRFSVENDQDLNLQQFKIPPLLLQPLLENSIWHGLSMKKDNKAIQVRVKQDDQDHFLVEVEDNGIGREAAHEIKSKKVFQRESLGLKLSTDRLKLFAQQREHSHAIEIIDQYDSDQNPTGTLIRLKIPTN